MGTFGPVGRAVLAAALVALAGCSPAPSGAAALVAPPTPPAAPDPVPPPTTLAPPTTPPTVAVALAPVPPPTRPTPADPVPAVGLPPAPADPPPAAPGPAAAPGIMPAQPAPAPAPAMPAPPPAPDAPPAPPAAPDKPFEWPTVWEGKNLDESIKLFTSEDPAVREGAAQTVAYFGPAARKPALQPLLHMLADRDPGLRLAAIDGLRNLAYEPADRKKVVEGLAAVVRSDNSGSYMRLKAVEVLTSYGGDAAAALPALTGPAHLDASWRVRKAIAFALGPIGAPVYADPPRKDPTGQWVPDRPGSEPAAQCLRKMLLHDPSAAVRFSAANALFTIGPPYSATPAEYVKAVGPYYDAVAARLKKEGGVVGKGAGSEKVKPEPDKATQVWLHVLAMMYDDREVKEKDTLQKLAGYLLDSSFAVRGQALNAIATLGPRAVPVLQQVRDCLVAYKDEPPLIASALGCLTQMGPDAAAALPDVERFRDETKFPGLKVLAGQVIEVLKGLRKAPPPGAKPADPAKPVAARP